MANIDEFRDTYLRLCKDHRVEAQDCIIQQLQRSTKLPKKGPGFVLNLSCSSLSAKTCALLGKLFATDRTFSELKFNDCMLQEEGARALINGIANNVFCRRLELKGNNIRGTAAEALGRMLRQNQTLLSVCLEWNAMGMLDASFGTFCEGLGSNTHLQVLDLRNNQVSHEGSSELAMALRRNNTLRVLDLRWNNVGLIGARALLDCLQFNKTLIKLDLSGNNVPGDLLKSIETAISHNEDRTTLTAEYQARSQMLSRELMQSKKDQQDQLVNMMDKLDQNEASMRKSTRSNTQRVIQLQTALDDRKSQINDMTSKISLAESELALSEAKVNELTNALSRSREEHAEMAKVHHAENMRQREEKNLLETKLNKEILELNDKKIQLEDKIDELERKCKGQQEHIFDLKEQLNHHVADIKLKSAHHEERIQLEKQKTKEAFREADEMKNKEIERMKKECHDMEKQLKERIQRLEMQRIELEEEISRQKSKVVSEKLQAEEHLLNVKQKIKTEEEQRYKQLEDKIRLLQSGKDDLNSHVSHQNTIVSDLQTKNASLVLENESLKRKIEDMNQELQGKNNEMMTEVGKVRIEMHQKIQKLENERMSKADLYEKVSQMEEQMSELKAKNKVSLEEREKEVSDLKDKVRQREMELKQVKDEDSQRTNMLQTALQSYVSRSPFSASSR